MEYHNKYPALERFYPETFLDPLQEMHSFNDRTFHQYIQSLYNFYVKEARKGELKSPLAAVTAVWSKASSLFCELYSFGGLTPESQRYFDRSFLGKLNRVTFGPPVESAEKIVALMESGLLNFETARNPSLSLDEKTGSYIIESRIKCTRHSVQYLLDARIPKMSLVDDSSSLFRNLLNRGLITTYENRTDQETYQTGVVNITPEGFVIVKHGNVNFDIAVTGTPTEGITFDNDTLSRNRNSFVDGWAEYISKEYAKSEIEHFLEAVLTNKTENGVTPAGMLRERNIELRMEPGRSLLDQTGMTIARVIHRKKDQRGDWLVGLEDEPKPAHEFQRGLFT